MCVLSVVRCDLVVYNTAKRRYTVNGHVNIVRAPASDHRQKHYSSRNMNAEAPKYGIPVCVRAAPVPHTVKDDGHIDLSLIHI